LAASPSSGASDGAVILLGLGYTSSRLARRLLFSGHTVFALARNSSRFPQLSALGVVICAHDDANIPRRGTVVHTIPPLAEEDNRAIRSLVSALQPKRVIYVSSTSIYGEQASVDESSPPAPCEDKGRNRLREEQWIAAGPWSALIVRPAAIYGPFRGVHVRLREGRLLRGSGGVVSRIHVDDLARVVEAGIRSGLEGAWPLADSRPCSGEEVAEWCHAALGLEMGCVTTTASQPHGRKVDGQGILRRLQLELQYPDFESGILASLGEESVSTQLVSKQPSALASSD